MQSSDPNDIPNACPQNNNLVSECFGAVVFHTLPISAQDPRPINYTLRTDFGLRYVDVRGGRSSYEQRMLPLQWAVDQAIIQMTTREQPNHPLEWPFTAMTNTDQSTGYRLSYVRGLRRLIVLAFFIAFVGISFQLPGAFASERADLLTSHLKVMGLMDSARILSWHIFHSLIYLPAWIALAIIWHLRILTETNVFLLICIHILAGLSLASHGLFVAVPFGKSPQLAAIFATLTAILASVLAQAYGNANTAGAVVVTLLLPPSFFVFAIHAVCRFEEVETATDLIEGEGGSEIILLPLFIVALINIFLWPYLAVLLERRLYGARDSSSDQPKNLLRHTQGDLNSSLVTPYIPAGVAISIQNLTKSYMPSLLKRSRGLVHAVQGLSLDIPKNGIFVLLGSNGAGKSTTLSILGGLLGHTSGSIAFADAPHPSGRPSRGYIGVVPQKNVMFAELTCLQNLMVWSAVKGTSPKKAGRKELEEDLRECDLGKKVHAKAGTMSGGQKRKLQLAIGLVGGSKIVLVDECTSGVDPLSRRALWRILTSLKHERTIIFTTHFLDEADLLGDYVAILAAPGRLVASGSPVSLKSQLGQGYTVEVSLASGPGVPDVVRHLQASEIQQRLRDVTPECTMLLMPELGGPATYPLGTKDPKVVQRVLEFLDLHGRAYGISSYNVHTSSLEDIFLELMDAEESLENHRSFAKMESESSVLLPEDATLGAHNTQKRSFSTLYPSAYGSTGSLGGATITTDDYGRIVTGQKRTHRYNNSSISHTPLLDDPEKPADIPKALSNGRHVHLFHQAMTIFYKRMLITKRAWLTPLLAVLVAVVGSTVPLVFISEPQRGCADRFEPPDMVPLYFPTFPLVLSGTGQSGTALITSPPGVLKQLGPTTVNITTRPTKDNGTFIRNVRAGYKGLTFGGVSFNSDNGSTLIAWEATSPGLKSLTLLNLASNILYQANQKSSAHDRTDVDVLCKAETAKRARCIAVSAACP